jgi:sec-independent protein translocase protein TatA
MGLSFSHLLLLLVIVLVIFGAGKLPQVMGDIAKGVKAFKDGMKDEENASSTAHLPSDSNHKI